MCIDGSPEAEEALKGEQERGRRLQDEAHGDVCMLPEGAHERIHGVL